MKQLKPRSEVEQQHTWNLDSLFPDEAAYETALAATGEAVNGLAARKGTLVRSSRDLASFLHDYFSTITDIRRLGLYASLPVSVDGTDQQARARAGTFASRASVWSQQLSFVDPELLEAGSERLEELATEDNSLADYRRYFQKLEARRPHVRSQETEAILGALAGPFGGVSRAHGSLVNGDLKFEPVTLPDGSSAPLVASTLKSLDSHPDRSVREQAYRHHTDGFLGFRNTLAELYLTRVRQASFNAHTRNYPSTVEEALSPREVPRAALEAVIRVFERRISVWHRYWELRRRMLGVDQLQAWDVFAPLGKPLEVPYQQAVDWIQAAVEPLGEDYAARLRTGLADGRWVDIYPNEGKRDGAFAAGAPGTQPFIMMSYDDRTGGLSTLAHELGHAMHGQLTYATQPPQYASYSMVVAETASNLHQALLFPWLLEQEGDREFRIAVIEEALYNLHRYFFIMPTLARFELQVHAAVERGEGLTADRLGRIMKDLFQEGYGSSLQVDDRVGITWATFGHLYVPFYTFQYSCGISAAARLAADLRAGKPGSRDAVLGFLKGGDRNTPMETLQSAGVDLTADAPFEAAFDAITGYLDQLEQLLED